MNFEDILKISEIRSLDYRNTIILIKTLNGKSIEFLKKEILRKTNNVNFRYYLEYSRAGISKLMQDLSHSRGKPRLEIIFVSDETCNDRMLNHITDFAIRQLDNIYFSVYQKRFNFYKSELKLLFKLMKWGNYIRKR